MNALERARTARRVGRAKRAIPGHVAVAVAWMRGEIEVGDAQRGLGVGSLSTAYVTMALRLRDAYYLGLIKDGDQT